MSSDTPRDPRMTIRRMRASLDDRAGDYTMTPGFAERVRRLRRGRRMARRAVAALMVAAVVAAVTVFTVNALRPNSRVDFVAPPSVSPSPTAAPGAVAPSPQDSEAASAAPSAAPPAAPSASETPSEEPSAEPAEPRLTADTPISLHGIGPIEVGMTLAEAERVAGVNLIPGNFEDFGQRCFFAHAEGLEENFGLILNAPGSEPLDRPEDGIIVTVWAGEGTQTLSGVGIGDAEEEVYDTYGDRIESGPPLFNESPVHFLTYIPRHPADQDYRVRFKTDGNVVQSIYAGYEESTEVIEGGCN